MTENWDQQMHLRIMVQNIITIPPQEWSHYLAFLSDVSARSITPLAEVCCSATLVITFFALLFLLSTVIHWVCSESPAFSLRADARRTKPLAGKLISQGWCPSIGRLLDSGEPRSGRLDLYAGSSCTCIRRAAPLAAFSLWTSVVCDTALATLPAPGFASSEPQQRPKRITKFYYNSHNMVHWCKDLRHACPVRTYHRWKDSSTVQKSGHTDENCKLPRIWHVPSHITNVVADMYLLRGGLKARCQGYRSAMFWVRRFQLLHAMTLVNSFLNCILPQTQMIRPSKMRHL